ncbi:uncharacterized protein LOC115785966 isoform X2 [Archocentrus centrarchus]|nr:uncharacterized protein LOC115785966 isoform X2 [Archocentrus centrarchus]
MAAALQEQLRELSVEEPGERPLHCSKLDRVLSLTSREMEEEHKSTDEDEEDAEESLSRKTLAFPETHPDRYIFIVRKSQKEECLKISLSIDSSDTDSSDGDTSEGETSDASSDVQTNLELAKGRQQKSQSCSPNVSDTSQSMKEEDRTRNPFHFMSNERSHEDEKDHVGNRNGKEPLLRESEWKEWLDMQEMKGNHDKTKPDESQDNTEKKGAAASGVSEKHKKRNMRGGDIVEKIKTYISDVFGSHSSYKWKEFENED